METRRTACEDQEQSSGYGLTVVVEDELVEHAAAGFLADVAVHRFGAEFVEGDGVGQRLGTRLDGEGHLDVADRVALAVDGAQTDAPVVGVHALQLRDVRGHLAAVLVLARPVERLDLARELLELGDDQLAPERPRDQHHVFVHRPVGAAFSFH